MTGIELIAQERQRQIDDKMKFIDNKYALPMSAAYLSCLPEFRHTFIWNAIIPEAVSKEVNNLPYIRQLQVAGALIAAEIDRLQANENS